MLLHSGSSSLLLYSQRAPATINRARNAPTASGARDHARDRLSAQFWVGPRPTRGSIVKRIEIARTGVDTKRHASNQALAVVSTIRISTPPS
jgi:hypothetical protein